MHFDWIMYHLFYWVGFVHMYGHLYFIWNNFFHWIGFRYMHNMFNLNIFHNRYRDLDRYFIGDWSINGDMDGVMDLLFDSIGFWHMHRYFNDLFDGIMDRFDDWIGFWDVYFDWVGDMFHVFDVFDIDNGVWNGNFLDNCQGFFLFNWGVMPPVVTFFAVVVAVRVNTTLVLFLFRLGFVGFCVSGCFFYLRFNLLLVLAMSDED